MRGPEFCFGLAEPYRHDPKYDPCPPAPNTDKRAARKRKPKRSKALAWDDKTPLRTGVYRHSVKGWYLVDLRKDGRQTVKGLDAAIAMRAAYDATHAAFLATETKEARRARNLAQNGGNSAQERAFAQRLLNAFALIGWECFILNDVD